jgi:hypothetical protein
MNHINLSNEIFKEVIRSQYGVNMNILDIIITNNLEDKIKIYCDNVYFTNEIYETLLEKYNNYNLLCFINKINIVSENIIKIIVKYKKIEYLKLLMNKFTFLTTNILLKYSLLYNFQYGIDIALKLDADYINILNEIK